MEAQGWVTRENDPADRRVRRVLPTVKALLAFDHIRAIADDVYAEALGGLSDLQRQDLTMGLTSIINNMSGAEEAAKKVTS